MDGVGLSHPCDLDSGDPCRNDGVDLLSTTNANIAYKNRETSGCKTQGQKQWFKYSACGKKVKTYNWAGNCSWHVQYWQSLPI